MPKYLSREPGKVLSHLILWTLLVFMIVFIVIASYLKVDVVTRAEGKVVPSRHLQVIETLEPGIIKKIYVKTGDVVKKDQVLMQMDDVRFKSEYQEGLQKEIALQAKIAGLQALALNKPFNPDPKIVKMLPNVVDAEKALYLSKKQELASLNTRMNLLQKEINLTKPLVQEGVMSTVELIRLERELGQLQGGISNFYSTALTALTEANDKLLQVIEENKASLDRLNRTTVRSPMYGVVKQVLVTTEGGTVKSDDTLVEIVPLDDTLLIEARVHPKDIAFVHLNQKASVKISAYDYTIYGGLDGYVENMGTDTLRDEANKEVYYQIWIRTNRNYVTLKNTKYLIFPGMVATVDILTGQRTLLHYILKPFMRVKESALIER